MLKSLIPKKLSRLKSLTNEKKNDDIGFPNVTRLSVSGKSSCTGKRVLEQSKTVIDKGHIVVDMSSQGLTMISGSLFTRHTIGALDLSSNNIRQLPMEIRKLVNLSHLDISKNSIRCFHPHDFGGLPAALSQINALEVLLISECNLPFIPPSIWKCKKLRVLDISRNRINILVTDIGELEKLEHLNAEQTNIISLPAEIAFCQELKELLLSGNAIEGLPDTMKELKCLNHLTINYRSFCGIVDGYMEKLLRKGQIRSEHLPSVIFEIPALTVLDLAGTKINCLPHQCVALLSELYLAKNFFQEIPLVILTLSNLIILDLTDNFITSIPSEIQKLRRLKHLSLDNNQITEFPIAIGSISDLEILSFGNNLLSCIPNEISHLGKLKQLILNNNTLTSLPDTIIELKNLQTLDVTDNQITSLPTNFYLWPIRGSSIDCLHTYSKFHKYGLWLYGNPLINPPRDVWITRHPQIIYDHLRKSYMEKKSTGKNRTKIFVMGDKSSGKTALCRSLGSKRASLIGESVSGFGATEYLELRAWLSPSGQEYLMHDFSGDSIYDGVTHLFLESKGLILLVYNASTYCEQFYHECIGKHIDKICTCAPESTILLIGTHEDELDEETGLEDAIINAENIISKIKEQLAFRMERINFLYSKVCEMARNLSSAKGSTRSMSSRSAASSEISHDSFMSHKSEPMKRDSESLRDQRQRLKRLRTKVVQIVNKVSIVSSKDITSTGIAELIDNIEITSIDEKYFSQVQKVIPSSWSRMKSTLKKRYADVFWVTWSEFTETAGRIGVEGGQEGTVKCLRYLRDTGQVLWYDDNPKMAPIVLHRPSIVILMIYSIYRKNNDYFNFERNRVFKSKGGFINEDEFNSDLNRYNQYGEITRKLLLCLWFHLKVCNERFDALVQLTSRMDLWYSVPTSDLPIRGDQRPLIVINSLNQEKYVRMKSDMVDLEDFEFIDELADDQREWTIRIDFPLLTNSQSNDTVSLQCRDVFNRLSCRFQPIADYRVDWNDRIYVEMAFSTMVMTHRMIDSSSDLDIDEHSDARDYSGGIVEICLRSEDTHRRSRHDFHEIIKIASNVLNSIPGLAYFMYRS